jgi:transcriptional regulator NrdR family protein
MPRAKLPNMLCPGCGKWQVSFVIDSRSAPDSTVRRRRRCKCGWRYSTYEMTGEVYDEMRAELDRLRHFAANVSAVAAEYLPSIERTSTCSLSADEAVSQLLSAPE